MDDINEEDDEEGPSDEEDFEEEGEEAEYEDQEQEVTEDVSLASADLTSNTLENLREKVL